MFAIKTRARYLTHGAKIGAAFFSLLPKAALSGCAVCFLYGALCSVYGADAVFGALPAASFLRAHPAAAAAAVWLLFGASVLLFLFSRALRFALLAYYYHKADPNQPRAHCFISLRTGVRSLYCDLQLGLRRCGWLALLLLPAAVTGVVLYVLLRFRGLNVTLFAAGCALTAAQAATGAAAAFFVNRRYCMTRYLMYLNPMMRVKDAVRNGVLLTRGKRAAAALCRLSALPWMVLSAFLPARPFCRAYVSLLDAVLCETLFAEDKTKVCAPAATFYIGKSSEFTETSEILKNLKKD